MPYSIEFKYRFELLIPLKDNRGRTFPWAKVEAVGAALLDEFGGCRSQPLAPYSGVWKHREVVYRDALLLFTVDSPRTDESLDWMVAYKARLKREFKQLDVYLAVTEILWL